MWLLQGSITPEFSFPSVASLLLVVHFLWDRIQVWLMINTILLS